jgi:hypothetical protein
LCRVERGREVGSVRFTLEYRRESRRIDDHFGNPVTGS